jgi:hypothetical protein
VDGFTARSFAIVFVVVAVITWALVAAGVRYLEALNRRDEDVARLERKLATSLSHEPALKGSSIHPVAVISLRGRPRIELYGWVQSIEVRDVAIRLVERQTTHVDPDVRVTDHLKVGGHTNSPAAG